MWLHYGLSAIIVLATLLAATWYATDRFHNFFIHHLQDTLESRALTVNQAIDVLSDHSDMSRICGVLQVSDPTLRVTVINTHGKSCTAARDENGVIRSERIEYSL